MNKAGYMAPWFCLGEQGPGVLNYFCPGSDHRHTCKCRKKSLTDGLMNRPIDRTLAIASDFNYNCQYMVLRNFSLIKFLFTSRRSMFVGVVFSWRTSCLRFTIVICQRKIINFCAVTRPASPISSPESTSCWELPIPGAHSPMPHSRNASRDSLIPLTLCF